MTATHILSRWRRVRGVLKQTSMWFTMLTIAEAGTRGIQRAALAKSVGIQCESLTYSLKLMRRAGLVTEKLGERTGKGKPATISTITAKGLEFLALKPNADEGIRAPRKRVRSFEYVITPKGHAALDAMKKGDAA